jgi:hypothetical protein
MDDAITLVAEARLHKLVNKNYTEGSGGGQAWIVDCWRIPRMKLVPR